MGLLNFTPMSWPTRVSWMLAEVTRLGLGTKDSLLLTAIAEPEYQTVVALQALISIESQEGNQLISTHIVDWIEGGKSFGENLREPKTFIMD